MDADLSAGGVRRRPGGRAPHFRAAAGIVRQSGHTYEQYRDLRAHLRSTTLSLSEEDSRDIPDYGDWRKHQMERMVIRKGQFFPPLKKLE